MVRTLGQRSTRARIASLLSEAPHNVATVGAFTLRTSQQAALSRLRAVVAQHGGALLADPPGTGKTIVALAFAATYRAPLVFVPSPLRAQWEVACRRAGVAARIVSLEALSRAAPEDDCDLVIVDEAHHLRTPTTRRFAHLASCAIGRAVLLLSATPVVNRRADLDVLLSLMRGGREVRAADRAALVVHSGADEVPTPAVLRLAPLALACENAEIAAALHSLPPPLPAADGRAALPLISTALAFAWASSLAALDEALRRRLHRGRAIADALREGRWPTRDALRAWVVGDDASQLAMVGLLTPQPAISSEAVASVDAHLAAIEALRAVVRRNVERDTEARASALRGLLRRHPSARVAVFCHHASTVRALRHALRDVPGLVAITGSRVVAAAGRWSREEILAALGPNAATHDARAVRLLLTTDLLSEGVEMQAIDIVVHGDAAWTPARLEQRVGRAARVGRDAPVAVTAFTRPAGAEDLLSLHARLRAKRRARVQAVAPASAEQRWRALLAAWGREEPGRAFAEVAGRSPGFIAIVATGRSRRALAGIDGRHRRRWQISTSADDLLAVAGSITGLSEGVVPREQPLGASLLHDIRRAITRWLRRERTAALLAPPSGLNALRVRVDALVRAAPLHARSELAAQASAALRTLEERRSAGTDRAIATLLRRAEHATLLSELSALAARAHTRSAVARESPERPRLVALLVVRPRRDSPAAPPAPAPPSASPEIAAPR